MHPEMFLLFFSGAAFERWLKLVTDLAWMAAQAIHPEPPRR
jgi:hypothetical protein